MFIYIDIYIKPNQPYTANLVSSLVPPVKTLHFTQSRFFWAHCALVRNVLLSSLDGALTAFLLTGIVCAGPLLCYSRDRMTSWTCKWTRWGWNVWQQCMNDGFSELEQGHFSSAVSIYIFVE